MRKIITRYRLRDKPILVVGTLREFHEVFRAATKEFEAVGGSGISFDDLTFFVRERHNQFSPRQLIEAFQYFKQEGFIHAASAHEVEDLKRAKYWKKEAV